MTQESKPEFSFQEPAIYKIKVLGEIKESWSEKLQGLQINVEKYPGKKPVTVLIGQINDQTALSGVLNTLYDFNMTIISVRTLKSK